MLKMVYKRFNKRPFSYSITEKGIKRLNNSGLELFISQDVMNSVKSIEELKELVTNKLIIIFWKKLIL